MTNTIERASDLLALAERVEKASGPDRELDAAISKAVRGFSFDTEMRYLHGPAYTASLDAAMTLVPEGWAKYFADDEHDCHACVWDRGSPQRRGLSGGCKRAATPALALTAAALRALASQEPKA